jgi:4-alpha-glucanotransferase
MPAVPGLRRAVPAVSEPAGRRRHDVLVLSPQLAELAEAYGIATDFWDWQGRHVEVSEATILAVLRAFDVDAADPEAALREHRLARWRRMLPPVLVTRQGRQPTVDVHVPHGWPVDIWVDLETGGWRGLRQEENWTPPQDVDGGQVGEATFRLPGDLPLGYHTVQARSGDRTAAMPVVVTPDALGLPEAMSGRRGWGLATQLYSVLSEQSWGVGDLTDLTDLAVWSAARYGADFVLVNPLHAVAPTAPMEPSPYLPTTRRFANPLYLRPERVPEYADLDDSARAAVQEARAALTGSRAGADAIDRDSAWAAKRQALELLHAVPRTVGREEAYASYRARQGSGLDDYATWCAVAEEHGPDWRSWPEGLRDPRSPDVAAYAEKRSDLVDLHRWLQWLLDEQLSVGQATARQAGMAVGVMHDLAVGVDVEGAEAWALQDVFAQGVTVGAPPDAFTQAGQDWNQPPWRPDRLAELGFAPFRDVVATVLRNAGGLRVDHVIGLFRLWWVPEGGSARDGTYVRYDHEGMVGVLALEAHRAGAVVVGEDVGTVEPWVREYLAGRGVLGTSILWFERDYHGHGGPLEPERWRELCLASVTTHDLPPTTGYLAADHVRLRDRLGLLERSLDDELADDAADREAYLQALRDRGLLAPDAGVEETVLALHEYLLRTPSRLLCAALVDAVGDRRTQNQPGTVDEYPNWRVALTGPDGEPVGLEDVFASDRVARLAALMGRVR